MLDLNETNSCFEFAKKFPDEIDILINNGGVSMRAEFADCDLSVFTKLMNINFYSGVALIKGFVGSLEPKSSQKMSRRASCRTF